MSNIVINVPINITNVYFIRYYSVDYCCSLLCNLPLHLMYKLERNQHHVICVLYKINHASMFYISALMRLLSWLKFIYCVSIG